MSNDKSKNPPGKTPEAKPAEPKAGAGPASGPGAKTPSAARTIAPGPAPVPAGPVPPLFRAIDWWSFAATTLLVFLGYWYTLAPDLTLQDSGELAVASMYAGVPHPPGYPVWTIYTWLFTLLPISNIAYRVALSSAVAAALSCGLIALMVSRGSSMMMEGIAALKGIERRWENALCIVSGFVAGMLIGFNGFMWSQAIIVEVYTLSVLSLAGVLVCLMRWIYAPHQYRYLYMAFFWFGICFNNHQSLLVVAIGLEVAILVVQPRLGRDLFFWNSIVWLGGLIGKGMGLVSVLQDNPPLNLVYNSIGVLSFCIWVYLLFKTKIRALEFARDFALVATVAYVLALVGAITHYAMAFYYPNSMTLRTERFVLFNLFGLGCVGAFIYLVRVTRHLGRQWISALICGGAWMVGAAFYVYMPLAGMTNPPLEWGYPRTVTGFFHAFTRGQYERIHPTLGQSVAAGGSLFTDIGRYIQQVGAYIEGALEEFNLVYLLMGLLVFFFYRQMQKRERAWVIGLGGVYFFLSFFLLNLLNPSPDRQSRDLNKVFFTASHVMIAMGAGYGLALVGAFIALHYDKARRWVLQGLVAAMAFALIGVLGTYTHLRDVLTAPFDRWTEQGGIMAIFSVPSWLFGLIPVYGEDAVLRFTVWFGLALAVAAFLVIYLFRTRPHLELLLVVCGLMPLYPILSHWSDNEQRGHLFGYWFGHDMFTPPFVGPDGQLSYDKKLREEMMKKPEGKLIYPEMDEHTVLYGGTDPGRFNPTYMIFCESFIPASKKPHDPVFDRRDVYLITQNALADGTYLSYIRAQYNRSAQIDPYFFSELLRGPDELRLNVETNILARMMLPIDRYFYNLGDRIEKRRRVGSSFFKPADFTDLAGFAAKLKQGTGPGELSRYLRERLTPETQQLLNGPADKRLAQALARDLNALIDGEYEANKKLPGLRDELATVTNRLAALQAEGKTADREFRRQQERRTAIEKELEQAGKLVPFYEPKRFEGVTFSEHVKRFIAQNPWVHSRIRLSRLLLEAAYPQEIARSLGGVYPDREIRTASNEDSQRCFQEYLQDAQRRLQHDRDHPNEPRQLRPGEDVRIIDNKVQVSGQVAVMAINALLTKVMFDANPGHEFYVEESFPLDWMYPYLTPYGIIMKINRNPLPELTEEILQRDHEFWRQFSRRLVGNWITYDTPISEICAFAERVYLKRNYKGFQGDRKFVRDNDGQKAFSKLRSSIAGVYSWRVAEAAGAAAAARDPGEQQRKMQLQQRVFKEAEFAFKQAYAYCPYSPEAIFRYINLLLSAGRVDDALLLARTSIKLDPYNKQLEDLVFQLQRMRPQGGAPPPQAEAAPDAQIAQLERRLQANPADAQTAMQLITAYLQSQRNDRAVQLVDQIMASPKADANLLLFAAQVFHQLNKLDKVEEALAKLVKVSSDNPEAWFDLAGLQAMLNKEPQALASLTESLRRSAQRLARDSNAANLYDIALKDARFNALRAKPEFQKVLDQGKPPGR